ncbi:MAG: DUF3791 domain-containing protein [Bacteroidales bacterium]|nr:DUF3791 domain-containing protein [Bacteroidales bacterium]
MEKKQQDLSYFVSFCVEQYKHAKQLTGGEAMALLDNYGVLDYLVENYEILHTQSHQWILEDIDEFIHIRQKQML